MKATVALCILFGLVYITAGVCQTAHNVETNLQRYLLCLIISASTFGNSSRLEAKKSKYKNIALRPVQGIQNLLHSRIDVANGSHDGIGGSANATQNQGVGKNTPYNIRSNDSDNLKSNTGKIIQTGKKPYKRGKNGKNRVNRQMPNDRSVGRILPYIEQHNESLARLEPHKDVNLMSKSSGARMVITARTSDSELIEIIVDPESDENQVSRGLNGGNDYANAQSTQLPSEPKNTQSSDPIIQWPTGQNHGKNGVRRQNSLYAGLNNNGQFNNEPNNQNRNVPIAVDMDVKQLLLTVKTTTGQIVRMRAGPLYPPIEHIYDPFKPQVVLPPQNLPPKPTERPQSIYTLGLAG